MDPVGKDLDIPKLLRFMTDPRGDGGAREILREEVNCYGTLRCKEVEVSCESGLQVLHSLTAAQCRDRGKACSPAAPQSQCQILLLDGT